MLQPAIQRQAAMIAAEMIEQYAQTVEPMTEGSDPLVGIRQQELEIKTADLELQNSRICSQARIGI